jgi:hypothetical protein
VLNGSNGDTSTHVAENLSNLLEIAPEKALRMLLEPGTTVRRGIDLRTAMQYQAAIDSIGASCVVEPEVREREQV